MMSGISAVDVDHLRRTLLELGYHEQLTSEAAPLVHHILADLNLSTKHYNDLLQHYDELHAQVQGEKSAAPPRADANVFDLTHISGLDFSMLGIDGRNLDESFILRAVEEARSRIEALQRENDLLRSEAKKTKEEKDALSADLQRSQAASQELSQLLHAKRTQLDSLQSELAAQRKRSESGLATQLLSLVRGALSLLPAELQTAFAAKLTDSEAPEVLLSVLASIQQRVRQELETKNARLRDAGAEAEKVRSECATLEETVLKLRTGVTQYQGQIAELNNRLHEVEVEKSMQADLQIQLKNLERVNDMIREKLAFLEKLKHENSGAANEFAQLTVQAILESLTTELHTEVGFSSHLNQIVEKLNARRLEQDRELSSLQGRIREAEERVLRGEHEKAQVKAQLEKALNDLARREGSSSTTDEVIKSLQQALDAKQAKIDEQKKYCSDLKTALDQCHASMTNMRRNEEMIRQHVVSQDCEIRNIKNQYESTMGENAKLVKRVADMEADQVMLKNAFREKSEEAQRLRGELQEALTARDKALIDIKSARDHIAEMEEALNAKRREKDLLMTTYCRVIKDNEKLHADMQKLHDDYMASRSGDVQSENALKAFQTKVQLQNQELERLRSNLNQDEAKILEYESKIQELQKSKRIVEQESHDREKEIKSLKGIISSLERSKKDIAAQMARFGQQANELRHHLRRLEDEKNDLQSKLRSATLDSPAARSLQTQLATMSMELEQTRAQLRLLERERDALTQHVQFERKRAAEMEDLMVQERNKRLEKENLVDTLENARSKLKEQADVLSRENDRGIQSIRKQMDAVRLENERLRRNDSHEGRWTLQRPLHGERSRTRSVSRNLSPDETPSPPDSPPEEDVVVWEKKRPATTERLRNQNKILREQLADIRNEVRQTLSPGKSLNADLESSITAITTSDETEDSTLPTSDEIISNNAEMRRKLEHENRILFKIVEKVKSELKKASMETPRSVSSAV